jgi:TolB protein
MNNLVLRILIGVVLLTTWSCNEDLFIEPSTYSSIRGQVLFSSTRKPAGHVLVRLSPTSRSLDTDSLGYFRFDSVLTGKYTLQAMLTGFLNEFAAIEVGDQQLTAVTLLLRDDKSQNKPSTTPTVIGPKSGSDTLKTSLTLRWKATDPDKDSLTYDVTVFQDGVAEPVLQSLDQKADSLRVKNLSYNAVYYWQVTVKDGFNAVKGDISTFRTRPFPEFPYVYVKPVNGRLQLFTSTGTGEEIQLTTQGSNWRPVASPNKREIAFISNMKTDLHLFIMNRDGSNLRQITSIPLAGIIPTDLSFCWSPDGTQLLYPSNNKLYAIQTNGTGLRIVSKLASGQFFSGCDWAEQGNLIVARSSSSDVYDNNLVLISSKVDSVTLLIAPKGRISNPVFSIDGKQLLYSYDISQFQNEQGRQLNAHIQLLTLQTGVITDLSGSGKPAGTNDIDPRFSLNGAKIIFTNVDNANENQRGAYVMDLSGISRNLVVNQAQMACWRQ